MMLKGLKGATVNQDVNNRHLVITVYGEIPETHWYFILEMESIKKNLKSFSFKGNDVLGTIAKPIVIGDIMNNVTIYLIHLTMKSL
jgi:hypothetical protein